MLKKYRLENSMKVYAALVVGMSLIVFSALAAGKQIQVRGFSDVYSSHTALGWCADGAFSTVPSEDICVPTFKFGDFSRSPPIKIGERV
jgi:hypothetical protein